MIHPIVSTPISKTGAQLSWLERLARRLCVRLNPNWQGTSQYPPGHFYSPLLDLRSLAAGGGWVPHDGPECWEHIDLRPAQQRALYENLLRDFPPLPFPRQSSAGFRYFTENDYFVASDAFVLSGLIRREKPRRIVEVGAGFSSAVMLDTLKSAGLSAALTFIDPHPERLLTLLSAADRRTTTLCIHPVQETNRSIFDQLEARDILFIDSSHVAKVGSDVVFLLLQVLPRLQPGVLVHLHDIFYPHSYPAAWIREGRAWNESLFLRAFLIGNARFEIVAFNGYAAASFPEIFRDRFPAFLDNSGGSLWLRKVA